MDKPDLGARLNYRGRESISKEKIFCGLSSLWREPTSQIFLNWKSLTNKGNPSLGSKGLRVHWSEDLVFQLRLWLQRLPDYQNCLGRSFFPITPWMGLLPQAEELARGWCPCPSTGVNGANALGCEIEVATWKWNDPANTTGSHLPKMERGRKHKLEAKLFQGTGKNTPK